MIGFGIAAGFVGVGGAVDVLSIDNSTIASIEDHATVYAHGDVFVSANDDTNVLELSGALAGGAVGIGGSVGVMLISSDTEATSGHGADGEALCGGGISEVIDGQIVSGAFDSTTGTGLIVQAESSENVLHIVAAGAGGFVGVSGAVGVTLISSNTVADVGANAVINGDTGNAHGNQNVFINAANDASVQTFVLGIAGGFVGVSGAVDVGTLNNNTSAKVESGATLNAAHDIEVNAVGLKNISGFDASGAGGFVGVGGAVSVWSVGTQIQKSSKDDKGNDTGNATDGNGKSADSNAGTQAQSATGTVTGSGGGGLGNVSGDGSGNAKTPQNRLQGHVQNAANKIDAKAPTAQKISDTESAKSTPAGTSAIMDGTAIAGHSIAVTANEQSSFSIIGGQFAGGFVGAGASVAIFSVSDNVSALADGTLSAGNTITVGATLNESVSLMDLDGAGGFVGIGAAVAVINDESVVQATIGNVTKATSVSVTAISNRTLDETTGQFGTGAVAVGASFTRVDVGGGTYASVDGGATLSSISSLDVSAQSTITPHTNTVAISAGIGVTSVNFSFVDVHPQVQAYIGPNAHVTASGGVAVTASSTIAAEADMFGVDAGGLAVGASVTHVTMTPEVVAALGDPDNSGSGGVHVTAAALTVAAMTPLLHGNVATGTVKATGSAGALIGITSTDAEVENDAVVKSYVGDNSVLSVGGLTTVSAVGTSEQFASANSNAGGLVAVGIATSRAKSNTDTEAFFGANVTEGHSYSYNSGGVTIGARSTDNNFAYTNAGSGGAIAGASASASTFDHATTNAYIGRGSQLYLNGGLSVGADHTAQFNAQITSVTGGLLAGAGASLCHVVLANTAAFIASNNAARTTVIAQSISLTAADHADKPALDFNSPGGTPLNVKGTTGGLVSGAGVDETTTIAFHTDVSIGDYATVSTRLNVPVSNNPLFTLSALNTFNMSDQLAFTTAGALSGASVNAKVLANGQNGTADEAHVSVGTGANLFSTGMITMAANGHGSIDEEADTDTYGAGTATLGQPVVDLRPDNKVEIGGTLTLGDPGGSTNVTGYGDVNLLAASDANYNFDHYAITARFDGFAGSAIPLSDVHATAYLFSTDTIAVDSGAHVATAGTANLLTPTPGPDGNLMKAQAKAESWVTDLQEALLGSGALLDFQNASAPSLTVGIIRNDGIVETGIHRKVELILGNPDASGGFGSGGFDGFTSGSASRATGPTAQVERTSVTDPTLLETGYTSDGITYQTGSESLSSALVDQIATDQAILAQYGSTNATLSSFYTHEIATLTAELAADGLTDGSGNVLNVNVMTVNIDRIFTEGVQLQGSGAWIAPSDADVKIINYTPAFLHIYGITVPDTNGGLFFNGVEETSNGDIGVHNHSNLIYYNTINSAAGNPDPRIPAEVNPPSFSQVPNPTAIQPVVLVENVLNVFVFNENHVNADLTTHVQYPWPDIRIMSTSDISPNGSRGVGISNDQGYVILATAASGLDGLDVGGHVVVNGVDFGIAPPGGSTPAGNIPILGPINALHLVISTNGTVLIDLPGQDFETAGTNHTVGVWDGQPEINPSPKSPTEGPYLDPSDPNYLTQLGGGVVNASTITNSDPLGRPTISDILAQPAPTPGIVGTEVIIRAAVVNLNGLVQSGKADYAVTIDDTAQVEADIAGIESGGNTAIQPLAHQLSPDFEIDFDPVKRRLIVEDTRVNGGNVQITGDVVNTGNGQIIVLGGYGNLSVTNNTAYDLEVHRLDVSTPGAGTLIINDTSGNDPAIAGTPVDNRAAGHTYTTLYQETNGQLTVNTDNGNGYTNTTTVDQVGDSPIDQTYTPMSDWRYGWTVAVDRQVKMYSIETSSSWIGLISTGSSYHGPFTSTIPLGVPQLEGAGPFYYTNPSPANDAYNFSTQTIAQTQTLDFDPTSAVSTAASTITLPVGLFTGMQVTYSANGNTAIGG